MSRATSASALAFLFQWTAVHSIAFTIAAAIDFGLVAYVNALPFSFLSFFLLLAIAGAISGLCIGGVEIWLLRSLIPKQGKEWLLATIISTSLGVIFGGLLVAGILEIDTEIMTPLAYLIPAAFGMSIGAAVGTAQWFMLRQRVRRAANWILATLAGRSLGWSAAIGFAIATIDSSISTGTTREFVLNAASSGAIGGTFYGVLTGFCLLQFKVYKV